MGAEGLLCLMERMSEIINFKVPCFELKDYPYKYLVFFFPQNILFDIYTSYAALSHLKYSQQIHYLIKKSLSRHTFRQTWRIQNEIWAETN